MTSDFGIYDIETTIIKSHIWDIMCIQLAACTQSQICTFRYLIPNYLIHALPNTWNYMEYHLHGSIYL